MTQYEKREIVKTLLQFGKLFPKEISVNCGISLATVYNVERRLDEGVSLSHQKGAGAPNYLRSSIRLSILHQVRCKPYLSLRTLASRTGNKAYYQTVRRVLKDQSYNKPYPIQIPTLSEKIDDIFTEFEAKECSMSADEWISGKTSGRKMIKFVPPGTKHEPSFIKYVKEIDTSLVPADQTLIGGKVVSDNWEASTSTESYDLLKKEFEAKCQEVSSLKSQLEIQDSKVLQLRDEIESLRSELKSTVSDSNLEI
ncbi:hypothetical protein LOD99_7985 [Oopsacas minuta]|uniref:Transposase n=1 Tax=Oopsacas minuta TaxID=111878 RepID=A0AAV7JI89_9METZ|nr:hypothetical protein LOD99_7985 [Oopsacas minuta]